MLRALVTTPRAVRVIINNPRLTVSIDLSDGLVVGASAHQPHDPGTTYEGALALAGLLVLSSGRVRVDPVQQPAVTNVMSTIDVALNMADSERSPIAPSIPTPHSPSLPPPPVAAPTPSLAPAAGASLAPGPAGPSLNPATGPSLNPAAGPSLRPASLAPAAAGVDELGGAEMAAPRPSPSPQAARGRRLGVSKTMAGVLIGLACAQGLLAAWFFGSLSKKSRADSRAAAPVVSAAPAAAAPPAASESAAPIAAVPPEPPRKAPVGKDESGAVVPSCASLLEPLGLDEGNFPGAAYEAQQAGARALVQGRVEDAELAYCKAVRWDAKNPQMQMALSQLFLIRKDGAAAAEAARAAIELDPNSSRAQSLLGDGLVRIGDHEGAKQAWLMAAGILPTETDKINAMITRDLSEATQSLRKSDALRAERFYRRAIVLRPDSLEASRGLAQVLNLLGDGAAAERWAQRALASEPRDPDTHVTLGDALMLMNDKAGAEREWREANRLDPSNLEAQKRIKKLRTLP
jgi:cytochrome c-type biogenesis protein CcmH/NrfG